MNKTNKNIGLFGSSFNPPHLGHYEVLKTLAKKNIFEEIWLVPVFNHPFAKEMPPFEIRLKMAQLLLNEIKETKLKITTIERDLNKSPSYMFDTLQALKKQHPETQFSLILGTDTKNDLPKWHRFEELKKIVRFYFIPRQGYEDSPFPDVSSSEIRKRRKLGKDIGHLTLDGITNYIIENKLYIL